MTTEQQRVISEAAWIVAAFVLGTVFGALLIAGAPA